MTDTANFAGTHPHDAQARAQATRTKPSVPDLPALVGLFTLLDKHWDGFRGACPLHPCIGRSNSLRVFEAAAAWRFECNQCISRGGVTEWLARTARLSPLPNLEPRPFPLADDFLAELFAARYAGKVRHVKTFRNSETGGGWLLLDDSGAWVEDRTHWVQWLMTTMLRAALYLPEAAELTPKEKRTLCSRIKVWDVMRLAQADPRIASKAEDVGKLPPARLRKAIVGAST